MTTNIRFTLDFYAAPTEEDSDPDPTYSGSGPVLADLYFDATHLLPDDMIIELLEFDRDGCARYLIRKAASREILGVAYVDSEEV